MKLLLLITSAPASGYRLQDSLDAALTGAVFGQEVSLLFMGAGVEHLPMASDNGLGALADYGIDTLYAERKALSARGLTAAALTPAPAAVGEPEIAALLASQHCVLHF